MVNRAGQSFGSSEFVLRKSRVFCSLFGTVLLALLCLPLAAQSGTGAGTTASADNGTSQTSAPNDASQNPGQSDASPASAAQGANSQGATQGVKGQGLKQGCNAQSSAQDCKAQGNGQTDHVPSTAQRKTPGASGSGTTNAVTEPAGSASTKLPAGYVD